MSEMGFLETFINKKVKFKFHGKQVHFYLSQSLFSSHDIDDGTKLLLRSLSKLVDVGQVESVLDIGCGVGVIGTCLKKYNPDLHVTFQDRDALALAFTEINAQLNQIGDSEINGALGLLPNSGQTFDLIVSNLPGKAGPPVLEDLARRIPQHLTERGRAAVVIVKPLANLIEQTLLASGSEILERSEKAGYAVFHFKRGETSELPAASLSPYVRGNFVFKATKSSFSLSTVYNVPEFDTLGYQTSLALNILKNEAVKGSVLVWNPGQGYLPVYLSKQGQDMISTYTLASRDLLSLHISSSNLMGHGVSQEMISTKHVAHFLDLHGEFDFIVLFPDVDPGVPWHQLIPEKGADLLAPGGKLLVTAKSSFMHRLLSTKSSLRAEKSKKRHGFRSALMIK